MYYLLKRLSIIIPTLLVITVIAFFLQEAAPGDPVEKAVKGGYLGEYQGDESQYRNDYLEMSKLMGRDKPLFYCSVISSAYPDNYFSNDFPADRQAIIAEVQSSDSWKHIIPSFHWHGLNNQYHDWLRRIILLDFGKSYIDGTPVIQKIGRGVRWTLTMNGIAILLAFIISIWLGVKLATSKKERVKEMGSVALYILYSIPSFWTATMLVVFFTTPEYGSWTDIFPSVGIGRLPEEAPFWNRFWETAGHLILPIFCLTYGVIAFISMQMRKSMTEEMNKQYIKAARARGYDEQTIIWREAFPNALFPLITLFAIVLPALFTGSVVIEVIFGIPGMGQLTYDAILGDDWPVVYGVLVVIAVITMIANLIGDILYAWFDPRVQF